MVIASATASVTALAMAFAASAHSRAIECHLWLMQPSVLFHSFLLLFLNYFHPISVSLRPTPFELYLAF